MRPKQVILNTLSANSFFDRDISRSHQDIRLGILFSITTHLLFAASLIAYFEKTKISPNNIAENLTVSILLNANSTSDPEENSQTQVFEKHKSHLNPTEKNTAYPLDTKPDKPADHSVDLKPHSKNDELQKYNRSINLNKAKNQIAQIAEAIAEPEDRIRYVLNKNDASLAEEKYLRSWREKCEEIGRRNYPEGRLEGEVTTRIAIASDGTLIEAMVVKSSGIASIDEAVIKTIREASPYQPFNIEMRKKYDLIEFIRLWKLSNSRQAIY